MNVVTVLYFAAARERTGTASERVEVEVGTVKELLAELGRRHPALVSVLPHLRIAVNQEFVGTDSPLPPSAEVALIPPVSGGSGKSLDPAADVALIPPVSGGAGRSVPARSP